MIDVGGLRLTGPFHLLTELVEECYRAGRKCRRDPRMLLLECSSSASLVTYSGERNLASGRQGQAGQHNWQSAVMQLWLLLLAHLAVSGSPSCDFTTVDWDDTVNTTALLLGDDPVLLRGAFAWHEGIAEQASFLERFGSYPFLVSDDLESLSQTGSPLSAKATTFQAWFDRWPELDEASRYMFTWHGPNGCYGADSSSLQMSTAFHAFYGMPSSMIDVATDPFFVIGSSSAGIRLHQHGQTWVALLAGEKRWYVKKGTTSGSEEESDEESDQESEEESGYTVTEQRWRDEGFMACAQQAGEMVLLPSSWLHATFDSAAWTVGFGAQTGFLHQIIQKIQGQVCPGCPIAAGEFDPHIAQTSRAAAFGNATAFGNTTGLGVKSIYAALITSTLLGHDEILKLLIKQHDLREVLDQAAKLVPHVPAAPSATSQMDQSGDLLGTGLAAGHAPVVQLLLSEGLSPSRKWLTALDLTKISNWTNRQRYFRPTRCMHGSRCPSPLRLHVFVSFPFLAFP